MKNYVNEECQRRMFSHTTASARYERVLGCGIVASQGGGEDGGTAAFLYQDREGWHEARSGTAGDPRSVSRSRSASAASEVILEVVCPENGPVKPGRPKDAHCPPRRPNPHT